MDDLYLTLKRCPVCKGHLTHTPAEELALITILAGTHCKTSSPLRPNHHHFEATKRMVWIDLESIKITLMLAKDATVLYSEGMQVLKIDKCVEFNYEDLQSIEDKLKIWLTFS